MNRILNEQFLKQPSYADMVAGIELNVARAKLYVREVPEFSHYADISLGLEVWVRIPWNGEVVEETFRLLSEAGFERGTRWGEEERGVEGVEFTKTVDDIELVGNVSIQVSIEGSTCELRQVGTKMVEKPIYELHCAEES